MERVDAIPRGAQCWTQVVGHTNRGSEQDDTVHAIRRQHFCGSQNNGGAGAVANHKDPPIRVCLAISSNLSGEPASVDKMVAMADVVGEVAPKAERPTNSFHM